MPKTRLDQIQKLFHAALELPEAARPNLLDTECDGDRELRAEVQSLLDSDAVDGDGLARIDAVGPAVGDHVGSYVLRERLGEGGMGIVFRAEQRQPVRRMVALKLLKAGLGSREVVARFEAERQALALMDHASIAKVFDAGTTEDGHPFFAMELIEGVPITDYCDGANLPLDDRVQLFLPVCRAVQHAHHNGVIHRDLKPNNVLVALRDGVPVPSIIDFGIAKAIATPLTDKTLYTAHHQVLGTLEYMSPEQAEMSPLRIDTRSDVYSLGVLLYELIAGVTPIDSATLREAALLEAQRLIRESDPPRPSTRVSTLGERAEEIARHRRVDVRTLGQRMRGDLDWITMRCLEKDVQRRYQSANDLAADLERHLRHEPVLAGPPGVGYRLSKFVRRNRVTSAVAAVVLIGTAIAVTLIVGEQQRTQEALLDVQVRAAELEAGARAATLRRAQEAIAQGQPRAGIRDSLESIPERYQDSFAWRYLHAHSQPVPCIRRSRSLFVRSLEFHKDGEHLLIVELEPTGESMVHYEGPGRASIVSIIDEGAPEIELPRTVYAARFLPDGRYVVTGDTVRECVELWDLENLEAPIAEHHHGAPVLALAVAGNRIASADAEGTVRMWRRTKAGLEEQELPDFVPVRRRDQSKIRALDLSRDGRLIAAGGDAGTAWILDSTTGVLRQAVRYCQADNRPLTDQITQLADGIRALAFSPDARQLAVAGDHDGRVAIWNVEDGGHLLELERHRSTTTDTQRVWGLAFGPHGRYLVSGGQDHKVRLHSARTGRTLAILQAGCMPTAAAFDAQADRIAIAGTTKRPDNPNAETAGRLAIWHLGDLMLPLELVGHIRAVEAVVTTEDGLFAFTSDRRGGSVRKWDLRTGRQLFAFRNGWLAPSALALRPNGERELAVGGESGRGVILDATTGQELRPFELPATVNRVSLSTVPPAFRCLAYSKDGKVLAAGVGHWGDTLAMAPILLYDASDLHLRDHLPGHRKSVRALEFSSDGRQLISLGYGSRRRPNELLRWDVTGRSRRLGTPMEARGWQLTVAPRGGGVYVRTDAYTIAALDPASGTVTGRWPVDYGQDLDLAFAPSGRELLVRTSDATTLWDAPPKNRLLTLPNDGAAFFTARARFVGDLAILDTGAHGTVTCYELECSRQLHSTRRTVWRAAQRVAKLLEENPLVSDAREQLATDETVDAAVRSVARDILAATSEDCWRLLMSAYATIFQPDLSAVDRQRAIDHADAAVEHAPSGTFHAATAHTVLGVTLYRAGKFERAIDALRKGTAMERLHATARTFWSDDFFRDSRVISYAFLAMARHRLGQPNAIADLRRAWTQGMFGRNDVTSVVEAIHTLDLAVDGVSGAPPYSAMKAAGPPDAVRGWHAANAWFPDPPDAGEAWLDLEYPEPMHVTAVHVYEVETPGAVAEVIAFGADGLRYTATPTLNDEPGILAIDCAPEFPVVKIRLVLDTRRNQGRNGIDTVELIGPSARAWPVRARAGGGR